MNNLLIIGAVAILILGGGYYVLSGKSATENIAPKAEVASPVDLSSSSSTDKDAMMDDKMATGPGVMFKSGKLTLEEGEKMTPITTDYTFKTGIKVMQGGKVMKADGTSFMLKDGQSVWQDGSIIQEKKMENETMTKKDMMTKDESAMKEQTVMKKEVMTDTVVVSKDTMMAKAGSYIPYDAAKLAMAKDGHVVLFFHAAWCPTCRTLDTDIKNHTKDIPANLTILDVDYDVSQALKAKYDVTYQHTLVQVDAAGGMIKKWSGSPSLAALVGEVK